MNVTMIKYSLRRSDVTFVVMHLCCGGANATLFVSVFSLRVQSSEVFVTSLHIAEGVLAAATC